MKRVFMLFLASFFIVSGCAPERPAGTVEYIKTTVRYYNIVSHFVNSVDSLAAEAGSNQEAKKRLEKQISNLKVEMSKYNELIPPEIKTAKSIHENMVKSNNTVVKGIDAYQSQIKKGNYDPKVIHTNEINQAIQEMGKLRDQAQTLGKY